MGAALLLDLGNHQLKVGRSSSEEACEFLTSLSLLELEPLEGILSETSFSEIRLSSVNPPGVTGLRALLPVEVPLFEVSPETLPMPVTSHGTGVDRILSGYAAWRHCQRACVVADLGTAWTLDFVDSKGSFIGGGIGPGLGLQESALMEACPHLGNPAPTLSQSIPSNTAEALACGTRGALAHALQGMVQAAESELGPLERFLTGGDAPRMLELLPDWQHCSHLVLEGLALWCPAPANLGD